jgi:hypothetical protein
MLFMGTDYSLWDFTFSRRQVWSLVFWDVAPSCHGEVDLRSRDAYCLHHQGDDDGGSTHPETSVHLNVTARRYIPLLWESYESRKYTKGIMKSC